MTRPRFVDTANWQQAEVLMQPVFIRLVDNLRKAMEQSAWKGDYREDWIWPEGVSAETQAEVQQLQAQLKTAPPDQAASLEAKLTQLPQPFPSYTLHLTRDDKAVSVDLWQLCYQICFKNYHPMLIQVDEVPVEVDTSLFDEAGEVDWQRLDHKAQQIVQQIFASLAAGEASSPS